MDTCFQNVEMALVEGASDFTSILLATASANAPIFFQTDIMRRKMKGLSFSRLWLPLRNVWSSTKRKLLSLKAYIGQARPVPQSPILNLPTDVLRVIIGQLSSLDDFYRLSMVNKELHDLLNNADNRYVMMRDIIVSL